MICPVFHASQAIFVAWHYCSHFSKPCFLSCSSLTDSRSSCAGERSVLLNCLVAAIFSACLSTPLTEEEFWASRKRGCSFNCDREVIIRKNYLEIVMRDRLRRHRCSRSRRGRKVRQFEIAMAVMEILVDVSIYTRRRWGMMREAEKVNDYIRVVSIE